MGSKRVSAVSVCVRDPAEIRPILKMWVLKSAQQPQHL